ncbi:MAG: exo-alpha-sialidase [Ignavibacteria bacterium]
MRNYFLAITFYFTLITFNSFAQWQPDVRLTNAPGNSNTTYNNAWCIASSGDVVHVVWFDQRDGNYEIYHKRSTDGGITWGSDTRLTNASGTSQYPSISVSGQVVHVVWDEDRDGNDEIYYKRSTDGGISWGADTRLTNAFSTSESPSIAVSGSVVHVVWYDLRDLNYEIYYKRSTDGGISWGADTRLTNNSASSWYTSVSVSGSAVHVVWHDNRDGNEIYYKRSTDEGVSWGADIRLTNAIGESYYSCGAVSGQVIHIVWQDTRNANSEIYYKRSTDGGVSWGADTRLTNDPAASEYPSVSVSGSAVHVVWEDQRNNAEIYYKLSTDGGLSWGADTRLTNNAGNSFFTSVSVSGSAVHVVWQDNRDGNYEIYYKRDPTGNPMFTLNLTAFIEGFYNSVSNNMISDTARVYLRNASAPYAIVDSSKSKLDINGTATFNFSNTSNGTPYYIVIKHRNSIETWSSSGNPFISNLLTYNFSTASNKAYGNNMKSVDASPVRFGIFSGDVIRDGFVNLTDIIKVLNDGTNFVSGYVVSDVSGDNSVNLTDLLITSNNSSGFVSIKRP